RRRPRRRHPPRRRPRRARGAWGRDPRHGPPRIASTGPAPSPTTPERTVCHRTSVSPRTRESYRDEGRVLRALVLSAGAVSDFGSPAAFRAIRGRTPPPTGRKRPPGTTCGFDTSGKPTRGSAGRAAARE